MSSIVIDFNKFHDGLVPAIIQDINTNKVLMLGYMNKEAFDATMSSTRITFFSRSKNRLWTKGEESGNFLELKSVMVDCDADALLFKAHPLGPVCHTGADTCWDEKIILMISWHIWSKSSNYVRILQIVHHMLKR